MTECSRFPLALKLSKERMNSLGAAFMARKTLNGQLYWPRNTHVSMSPKHRPCEYEFISGDTAGVVAGRFDADGWRGSV